MLRYYREIPVIADTGSVSDEFRLPGINADCVRSILVHDGGLRSRIQRPPPPIRGTSTRNPPFALLNDCVLPVGKPRHAITSRGPPGLIGAP